MVGRFEGRDIIENPHCPFCGLLIPQPRELETRMPYEMPVGRCECGAVYAYDATGHNLGTAMIDALLFGCDGDWDLAWGLLPEEDYEEKQIEHYDLESHLVVPGGAYEGRRIAGTLYFIRLHKDIREITDEGAKRRLEKARLRAPGGSGKKTGRKAFSKMDVELWVHGYDLAPILETAAKDKRIIRDLQRLIYAVDDLLRWRATDALGQAAAVIARYDPGAISKLLQRLFTAVSDTAASSWGCIDAIGEIISKSPEQFGGYAPQLLPLAGDRELLAEVLRALGRISKTAPTLLRNKAFHFISFLQDPEAEIRGYAAVLLGNLAAVEAEMELAGLTDDTAEINVYRSGALEKRTVGQLAAEALLKVRV